MPRTDMSMAASSTKTGNQYLASIFLLKEQPWVRQRIWTGNYVLEADKDDVLVYSFIGYATAETRVGRKNTIDVVMEPDITQLSEVVVTGYGVETKKEALAGSVRYIVSQRSR